MADMAENPDKLSDVPDEEEFLDGASHAIQTAIEKLHRAGIATVHALDGRLIRVHPDGRHEDLGPVPAS
jgi:hypothetical protein